jgi:hypothetical protein
VSENTDSGTIRENSHKVTIDTATDLDGNEANPATSALEALLLSEKALREAVRLVATPPETVLEFLRREEESLHKGLCGLTYPAIASVAGLHLESMARALSNDAGLFWSRALAHTLPAEAICCTRESPAAFPQHAARPAMTAPEELPPKPEMPLVRNSEEWDMLERWMAEGRAAETDHWLWKRAYEEVTACKKQLGFRRGRKPKPETEKRGYRIALKVAQVLPRFQRGMREKNELKKTFRMGLKRLEAELSKRGYSAAEVECLVSYSEPVSAACAWVSENSQPRLELQTVQNYYSKHRRDLPSASANHTEGAS